MQHRVRLNPLLAPFVSRLLRPNLPEAEVLQPEEVQAVRPPALLEGMLDRVTGTDEHSVLSDHIAATLETRVVHAPVLRRTFSDALVNRAGFATWRHKERYPSLQKISDFTGPIIRVPLLRYCHNYVTWRYFGHWLTDAIPSSLIDPNDGELWMPPHPDWSHAADYERALDLAVLSAPMVHAERLVHYQDFGQGTHKQARYAAIRDALQDRFGTGQATDWVYIRRGRTGAPRWIRDEAKLIDDLTAQNWKIIDIAVASMEDLQRVLCRARVVVSIDGSHLDHAHLSLLPGSTMVILMPQDRYSSRQLGPCRAHEVSPAIVVLTGSQVQGYSVDLYEVLRTVDLAQRVYTS